MHHGSGEMIAVTRVRRTASLADSLRNGAGQGAARRRAGVGRRLWKQRNENLLAKVPLTLAVVIGVFLVIATVVAIVVWAI